MATISAALKMYDGITGPLKSMTKAMNIVINTFESMQAVSSRPVDIAAMQTARSELANVNSAVILMESNLQAAALGQENLNASIRRGRAEAGGLGSKIGQFVKMYAGVRGIQMGVRFVADTISLQNVQTEAETKLGAIMQQRMGADASQIQSIKNLTAAQQHLGVVGDEVQLAGAQQLSTFLNSSNALTSLVPAMNNLAVQQNGVNVSSEAMVNIGNMMGKVMQGQVGALTRVGVTFTEAQEHVLKFGNEQERAATLAQVITDNVSNMNEIMANTPQGKIQAMANTWGDIKENVGAKLYPAVMRFFTAISTNMPQIEALVMGVAGAFNVVITALSWLINGAGAVVGFFQDNWPIIEPIMWGIIGALMVYKGVQILVATATAIQTTAQTMLNAAMYACPITWIAIAYSFDCCYLCGGRGY